VEGAKTMVGETSWLRVAFRFKHGFYNVFRISRNKGKTYCYS